MAIEIKHKWSQRILYTHEGDTLRDADLRGADLRGADLRGADLEPIKNDLFVVLLDAIPEIAALKAAITEGRIDGSTYSGECSCLAGTIGKARGLDTGAGLPFANSRRPIERFFMGIRKDDTPENSQFSKLALEWVEDFESKLQPEEVVGV